MKFIIKLISILFICFSALNANVVTVNSLSQLQNIIANNGKVIIKFYADFCSPCKGFAPIYQNVSNETTFGSVVFVEVNIQKNQDIARAFDVKTIPTLIFTKNGSVVLKQSGGKTSDQFRSLIKGQFSL